jgi:hypothetical protein
MSRNGPRDTRMMATASELHEAARGCTRLHEAARGCTRLHEAARGCCCCCCCWPDMLVAAHRQGAGGVVVSPARVRKCYCTGSARATDSCGSCSRVAALEFTLNPIPWRRRRCRRGGRGEPATRARARSPATYPLPPPSCHGRRTGPLKDRVRHVRAPLGSTADMYCAGNFFSGVDWYGVLGEPIEGL